jgi:hypothetical protein
MSAYQYIARGRVVRLKLHERRGRLREAAVGALNRIAALVLLLLLLCHGVERRLLERMEARAKSDH